MGKGRGYLQALATKMIDKLDVLNITIVPSTVEKNWRK